MNSRSGTLVIRPEKIGDVIAAMPALRALRSAYPDEPLWLLTDTLAAEVIKTWPVVDHVVSVDWRGPRRGEHASWREIRSRLQAAPKFRRCVILYDGHPAMNLFALSLGIPRVAQLGFTWLAPLLGHRFFLRRSCRPPFRYSDFFLGVAGLAGARGDGSGPGLHVPEAELASFKARFPDYAAAPMRVLVHPFHNASGANLGREAYLRVCADLSGRLGCTVHVVGTSAEAARLGEVPRGVSTELLGRLTLRELMAALSLSDLTIGGSSGVLHIAGALGRPTLGLFCPHHDPLWKPPGPNSAVLLPPRSACKYLQPCVSGCGWPKGCDLAFGVEPSSVVETAAKMLADEKG